MKRKVFLTIPFLLAIFMVTQLAIDEVSADEPPFCYGFRSMCTADIYRELPGGKKFIEKYKMEPYVHDPQYDDLCEDCEIPSPEEQCSSAIDSYIANYMAPGFVWEKETINFERLADPYGFFCILGGACSWRDRGGPIGTRLEFGNPTGDPAIDIMKQHVLVEYEDEDSNVYTTQCIEDETGNLQGPCVLYADFEIAEQNGLYDSGTGNYVIGKPHVHISYNLLYLDSFVLGGINFGRLSLLLDEIFVAEGDPSTTTGIPFWPVTFQAASEGGTVFTPTASGPCDHTPAGRVRLVQWPTQNYFNIYYEFTFPIDQTGGTLRFKISLTSHGNEFVTGQHQPYVQLLDNTVTPPVNLSADIVGDYDNDIVKYQWFKNFEDATTENFLGEGYPLNNVQLSAGTHEITLVVYDSSGSYNSDSMMLTVLNVPPKANDDSYRADEDTTIVGNVLSDDTDANGDVLRAIKLTDPTHGTLSFYPNGNFTYSPDANWYGTDSFTYEARDDSGGLDSATVNIMILPVNDPPVAVNDAYNVDQCTVIRIRTDNGVLKNDDDVEGDPLTAKKLSDPTNGTLAWDPSEDGSFSYAPSGNYYGNDSFTYVANDGELDSNVATVSITVNKLSPDKQMEYCLESTVLASPDLDEGIKRSLLMKLDMAIQKYQTRGQIPVACKLLQAFINEVTSLISDGVMPRDDGYELIDFANDILADINC